VPLLKIQFSEKVNDDLTTANNDLGQPRSPQRLKEPTVITLISPPLAPNSPAPDAFPQLANLYSTLSKHPAFCEEDVCFAGDSSGANIALALTMHRLRSDASPASHAPEAPGSLLLVSPTVNLRHEHPDIEEVDTHNPVKILAEQKVFEDLWRHCWIRRSES
jgi:acetyl esterase/lipase